jgi:hypothetical protein
MIISYFILAISSFMIYVGFTYSIKFSRVQDLCKLDVVQGTHLFIIPKLGKYSVCLLGGGTIKNFNVNITSSFHQNKIQIQEAFPKYKFNRNGVLGVTYYDFFVQEKGDYFLEIIDIDNLSVKPSQLASRSLFEKKVNVKSLSILIKEYASPFYFITALLLIIIGLIILSLDIVYILYNFGIIFKG